MHYKVFIAEFMEVYRELIFMSCYIPKEELNETIDKCKTIPNIAANLFQWNLLDGFNKNNIENLNIINALPVGTWPTHYSNLCLESKKKVFESGSYYETPTINIPVLKQISRYFAAIRILKNIRDENILIYSTYFPFVAAATKKSLKKKVTLIVTDLPQYYDLEESKSWLRKSIRNVLSSLTNHFIKRVDKFVLLTFAMHEILAVNHRPYIVLEGIVNCNIPASTPNKRVPTNNFQNNKEKVIVLYTGTLTYKYGIGDLLNILKQEGTSNIELWICGKGEAEELIINIAKEDNRLKYFGFLGIEEVNTLQEQATILINPRKPEGEYTKYSFPSKTMEYLLSGTPVIMYKLDGIPDEYDDYLFYISDKDKNAILDTINSVVEMDEVELKTKVLSAQQFVIKNKNAKFQCKKILDLVYEKIFEE